MRANLADQRILIGTTATLSWQAVDGDGEPVDPGVSTVTVRDGAGVAIATDQATTGTSTDPRTFDLDASDNQTLDVLTATWTDADGNDRSTLVEVVGGYYFSVAEARSLEGSLVDVTSYPTADLIDARWEVEATFEEIVGYAMEPRYRKVVTGGSNTRELFVGDSHIRQVRSVRVYTDRINYTTFSDAQLDQVEFDPERAVLCYPGGWWTTGNVVVEYEHGLDSLPRFLKRHAVTYLRHLLNQNRSGIPDRAERYQPVEGGTYFLSMPGRDKTGIPEVDAALQRASDGATAPNGSFFGVA